MAGKKKVHIDRLILKDKSIRVILKDKSSQVILKDKSSRVIQKQTVFNLYINSLF